MGLGGIKLGMGLGGIKIGGWYRRNIVDLSNI
jgi:hypothetical protein